MQSQRLPEMTSQSETWLARLPWVSGPTTKTFRNTKRYLDVVSRITVYKPSFVPSYNYIFGGPHPARLLISKSWNPPKGSSVACMFSTHPSRASSNRSTTWAILSYMLLPPRHPARSRLNLRTPLIFQLQRPRPSIHSINEFKQRDRFLFLPLFPRVSLALRHRGVGSRSPRGRRTTLARLNPDDLLLPIHIPNSNFPPLCSPLQNAYSDIDRIRRRPLDGGFR